MAGGHKGMSSVLADHDSAFVHKRGPNARGEGGGGVAWSQATQFSI